MLWNKEVIKIHDDDKIEVVETQGNRYWIHVKKVGEISNDGHNISYVIGLYHKISDML